MTGKKRTPATPAWFDFNAYRTAERLDAGDWLLNLALRRWLHAEPDPQAEVALRHVGPVLHRNDEAQIKAMHLADRHRWINNFKSDAWTDGVNCIEAFNEALERPHLPDDVWTALLSGKVSTGVQPLSLDGLYFFEQRLPDHVRKAGARFVPGDSRAQYPREFNGNLDDAFGPDIKDQLTNRFILVDLTLPDDVLHADLKRYLASERQRLRNMGGVQPYREAASINLKAHDLRTLAADGLLQFLDLDRWQRAEGLRLSFYAVREMAQVDRSREASLKRRIADAQNQLKLHAWFARLERSVKVTTPPRRAARRSSQ